MTSVDVRTLTMGFSPNRQGLAKVWLGIPSPTQDVMKSLPRCRRSGGLITEIASERNCWLGARIWGPLGGRLEELTGHVTVALCSRIRWGILMLHQLVIEQLCGLP